jgi:energy-coupling factor transporter ATP-binding protein EcfA2
MRIDSISLSWFRGAAEAAAIRPTGKSMVVYGENGSGKSSFVDAVEYSLHDGKIGHLAHEYSGKHQERGVLNTHTPPTSAAEIRVRFADTSERVTTISGAGVTRSSGADAAAIQTWDYRRTILRQHEVVEFIQDTKGNKYSALLPLLGLHHLEVAAENLRQLRRAAEQESKLASVQGTLDALEVKRRDALGGVADAAILERIKAVHAKYCGTGAPSERSAECCRETEQALTARIEGFNEERKRQLTLESVGGLKLGEEIRALRSCSSSLAGTAEPLLTERLEVLQRADRFVEKCDASGEVACPACGSMVEADGLRSHIAKERERLRESLTSLNALKEARNRVSDTVSSLKQSLGTEEAKGWRTALGADLAEGFEYLDSIKTDALRASCSEDDTRRIEEKLLALIDRAAARKSGSPELRDLLADKKTIENGGAILAGAPLRDQAIRAKALLAFLGALEDGVRAEIRLRSQTVIDSLSTDIQRMWGILHPGEAIADVRLCVPEDADKAIDVQLQFFGVAQESPRLTLSEGHRNSLGLCIFLAMAKRDGGTDRPLFLDDVVVSLDRNHRGMIVELLEREFSQRQVILLTHEREWYAELRQQLDGSNWGFTVLMPYESPEIGIRVSDAKTATFDDARALLKVSQDSAGNTTRKIMDIELAVRASRLKLRLPYLHREKNDHRVAHNFLAVLISDGAKCFQIDEAGKYVPYTEAIAAFREADRLLVSWGNRASHTFDIVKSEAEKLIAVCEVALGFFVCPKCAKPAFQTDDANGEYVQCRCGTVRWRYGKA